MKLNKITPILVVDSIEDSLGFWRQQLGYRVETEVPHGDRLGFVILKQGSSEIMLQSKESILHDLTFFRSPAEIPAVLLYGDVPSLDAFDFASEGCDVLIKDRTTFYGAKESWVRTRQGHFLGVAEFKGTS